VEDMSISEIISTRGGTAFRSTETNLLQRLTREVPYGYVVACGGGNVYTPEARKALVDYYGSGGIVLRVQRDTTRVLKYLQTDKTCL
jgi:pentafunctional AROM polypeptide